MTSKNKIILCVLTVVVVIGISLFIFLRVSGSSNDTTPTNTTISDEIKPCESTSSNLFNEDEAEEHVTPEC